MKNQELKRSVLQLLHAHFSCKISPTEYTKQGVLLAERNLWQEVEQWNAIEIARLIVEMEMEKETK